MDTPSPAPQAAEPSSAPSSSHSLPPSSKRPRFLPASSSRSPSPLPLPARSHRASRLMESATESSGFKKGKEKESELRLKIREKQRSIGLSIDADDVLARDEDDDDDDNDDDEDDDDEVDGEGSFGILHQNLTSASSALQGLLRKLGAGLDELLPSAAVATLSGSGRFKKILSSLREEGEEGRKIEALTQLCDLLLLGTEDSLCAFPVDSFVPVLVELLNYERNADIMLLAVRAITHLCDVLPSSCSLVLHYGAVRCFCANLLEIECMDLAEQSLQALKKISQEQPTACLRAGALMAILSFLDFFPTGVQRVALSTAANICKKLPPDAADFVIDVVPFLTNLLQCQDSKVLEHSSVCLTQIVEAISSFPDKLDEICNLGLIKQVTSLISTSNSGGVQACLSISTYTGLIRLLSICAKGSPLGVKTLLHLEISGILKDTLPVSSLVGSVSVAPSLSRTPDQIFEIVNLADELLPPLPEGTISNVNCSSFQMRSSAAEKSPSIGSGKEENAHGSVPEASAHEKILCDQPKILKQFGVDLLPVLVQIYEATVNVQVRNKCLSVIGKLMYFCTADMILALLNSTNISSFVAGVLASKDSQVLIAGLQMAEILMEKLPKTFSKMFVREGVLHAVEALISHDSENIGSVKLLSAERGDDCIPKMSLRSRCYHWEMGYSNLNESFLDEPKVYISAHNGPSSASIEIPGRNSRRLVVRTRAEAFKCKYFPSCPGEAEVEVTDDLLRLKNLCVELNQCVNDKYTKRKGKSKASVPNLTDLSAGKEEYLIEVISTILAELSRADAVSTFEFISSGVVTALLNYFSCGAFSMVSPSDVDLSKFQQLAFRRFKSFIAVALPSSIREGDETPLIVLIRNLQNALSSLEQFPVVLSHSYRPSSGNAHFSSGLGALSQPFKLHLCRAQGDKSLRNYSSNIVLIDPLASLTAVEEFLWPRVIRNELDKKKDPTFVENLESETPPSETGTSLFSTSNPGYVFRQSASSRSTGAVGGASVGMAPQGRRENSMGGKGKDLQELAQDEERGPRKQNITCQRAASDKDVTTKSAPMESNPEDQEVNVSPIEIDDNLGIEEDISDDEDDSQEDVLRNDVPFCTSEQVHDVKLGDPVEDGMDASATTEAQTNPRSGSDNVVNSLLAFGSKGAMSIVASVAISGLVSPNCGGLRSGRGSQGITLGGSKIDPPKLIFSSGGKLLNRNMTVYQAIRCQVVPDEDDERCGNEVLVNDGSRLWRNIYTITYQRADKQVNRISSGSLKSTPSKISESSGASKPNPGFHLNNISLTDSFFQWELPCDLEKSNPTYNILALLRILECLSQNIDRLRAQAVCDDFSEGKIICLDDKSITHIEVPPEKFINGKITPKLSRQIQDVLAVCGGTLPSWCYQLTKACPFLFPFETRRQYFYSTAFGLPRALNWLQQQQGADGHGTTSEREVRLGRLQRQKVRVSRNRILDSARKVMELYSSQKAVLEVEYFGEVGTGLGPTLEFYTLLSHDLQKVELGMWRSSSTSENLLMDIDHQQNGKLDHFSHWKEHGPECVKGNGVLVQAPLGLFPRPWPPTADASGCSQFTKAIEYYHLLGQVMAKALQDGRLLDLPLSMAFYKLVLGQDLDLHDILSFDAELGKILQELKVLVCRKEYLGSLSDNGCDAIDGLCFHGAPIEDLCLDFTLPGYADYILKPGYKNVLVDSNNLDEYISLVVDATVNSGIMRQVEAFRAGFNQVFEISSLQIFSPYELDYLLCGRRELWKMETLAENIKFDHGYTAKSPVIINFLEIMGEFTPEQQHAFCQFITGAPRLPPGGLAMLNPKLTVVRKHPSRMSLIASMMGPSESADEDLPSVMTCANYLKLPPYSTKEIMYKKLLYAINEGQGSFDLS